jgi:hypothetical protein
MRADLSRLHISSESFQNIYKKDWALKRRLAAPLVEEREQFLTYLLRIPRICAHVHGDRQRTRLATGDPGTI